MLSFSTESLNVLWWTQNFNLTTLRPILLTDTISENVLDVQPPLRADWAVTKCQRSTSASYNGSFFQVSFIDIPILIFSRDNHDEWNSSLLSQWRCIYDANLACLSLFWYVHTSLHVVLSIFTPSLTTNRTGHSVWHVGGVYCTFLIQGPWSSLPLLRSLNRVKAHDTRLLV